MSGDERRRQLLDVAAAIVVAHGAPAMSMERLAVEAGVSKALPYKHFVNSEHVLVELYRRETIGIGRTVWRALSDAPAGADLVRVGASSYLDEIIVRGSILDALSRPGSSVASAADNGRSGVVFEVDLFERFHGLERERAKAVAGMVQGAVVGAAGTLQAGYSSREQVEDDLVTMITAVTRG